MEDEAGIENSWMDTNISAYSKDKSGGRDAVTANDEQGHDDDRWPLIGPQAADLDGGIYLQITDEHP